RHGLAVRADSRVDDGEVDAFGHVRQRAREHEGALQHLLGLDAVRDAEDVRVGRDPLDHAVAGADEVVLEAEVGQEGDDHAERLTMAFKSPSASWVFASARTRRPAACATAVVCGPIETAAMSSPSRPNARAAEPDAST